MTGLSAVDHGALADDGVPLHVRVEGNPRAAVSVVLCHGYGLNHTSWRFQRAALAGTARVVSWDQRGHGCSGTGAPGTASIDQFGRDLYAVIDQCVPEGPVVLVGHSMGGMTIMALAAEHPELFGERVRGVALVATSAGSVGIPSLGVLLDAVAHRAAGQAVSMLHPVLRLVRCLPGYRPLARDLTRRFAFASNVSVSTVDMLVDMMLNTPPRVMAEVFPRFRMHDKLAALAALRHVTTLVLVGEKDVITPVRHSREIVAEVPGADLVVVPDAGHVVMLERPDVVNEWLRVMLRPGPPAPIS